MLLVACPGATGLRLEAEAAVRGAGGRLAEGPADADVLLVVGSPGTRLGAAVETVWSQLPEPRARGHAVRPGRVAAVLDGALARLLDDQRQAADAAERHTAWPPPEPRRPTDDADAGPSGGAGHGDGGTGDGGREEPHAGDRRAAGPEHAAEGHGEHAEHGRDEEHGSGEHGQHGGHERHAENAEDAEDAEGARDDQHGEHADHSDHSSHGDHSDHGGMEMPGGLAMADRAEDRDGLKLDVLHVPLGPVLPHWPPGLVVDTLLQGDVVQRARARVVAAPGAGRAPFWRPERPAHRAARRLDSLGRLLAVAGWEAAAARAGELRDRLLGGAPESAVRADFVRLRRSLERSRLLRWATDGVGVLDAGQVARLGLPRRAHPPGAAWDATARWRWWLAEAAAALAAEPPPGEDRAAASARVVLDVVEDLLPGVELGEARLLVASLDPDTDAAGAAEGGTR